MNFQRRWRYEPMDKSPKLRLQIDPQTGFREDVL